MRRQILPITKMVLSLAVLSACSGGHSDRALPTTATSAAVASSSSTTAPIPALPTNATAIASFLNHRGSPVVAFERATADLARDAKIPTRATCEAVRSNVAHVTNYPETLLRLASRVPDPILSAELEADINAKGLLLGQCGHNTSAQARTVQATSRAVKVRLKQAGVETG